MAETRLRISKQLEKSVTPGSIVSTDALNEQVYVAPGTNGQILAIQAGVPTYVDPTIAISVQNGLTETAPGDIELGGTLLKDTDIALAGFDLTLSGVGNLGVGTTTPTEKLDVVGNVQFSQALMPAGVAGTTGQVLVSQGAGVAPIWSTPTTRTRDDQTGITGSTVTLPVTPVSGLEVNRNGMLQTEGATNDYTVSGAVITFTIPLLAWEQVQSFYNI